MAPVQPPRNGERLRVKDRPVEFSFWPVERTTRRYGLGSRVFATDPWTVIRRATESRCDPGCLRSATAMLEQAEDFFIAAGSGVKAAKPLLLYYCFMNLGKAFVLATARRQNVNSAQHGLSEQLDTVAGGRELVNAFLNAFSTAAPGPIAATSLNVFDEILQTLTGNGLPASPHRFDLVNLIPQIVPGHRLWVEATGRAEWERFVAIEKIEFWTDTSNQTIWTRLFVAADDLTRIDLGHRDLLVNSRLANTFQEVKCDDVLEDDRRLLCFEQSNPLTYRARPTDDLDALVSPLRAVLWRTVLSQRPYRQYYLYSCPPAFHGQVMPQIMSIYAITYYLGSIVRYRPHHFDDILAGEFGPFIEAFLNDQPNQFIFLMASEFAQREVTKAAIV